MREQFLDPKAAFLKSKGRKARWLFALCLVGLALFYIGLSFKSQARKEQPFRTLITQSYASDVVAFSPDGKLLASAHRVNPAFFKVWDLETDTLLQTVETIGNGGIGLIAMSPDKTMIVTSGRHDDERLFLWDLRTGKALGQMTSEFFGSSSLIFSPDSKWIINSGFTHVEFWDVATKKLLRVWREANSRVFVALMPDGETLMMAGDNGIKFRNLQTGRLLRQIPFATAPTKEYLQAALSPDGKTLALGVRSRIEERKAETIEIWDLVGGKLKFTLSENQGNKYNNKNNRKAAMQSLSFSRDGKLLSSSSNNQPVKLWNVQTGSLRVNLEAKAPSPEFKSDEKTAAFSPDGKTLAVGTYREVHLWKVDAALKWSNP